MSDTPIEPGAVITSSNDEQAEPDAVITSANAEPAPPVPVEPVPAEPEELDPNAPLSGNDSDAGLSRLPDHHDFGEADDAAFKALVRRNIAWFQKELQWHAAGYSADQRADVNP